MCNFWPERGRFGIFRDVIRKYHFSKYCVGWSYIRIYIYTGFHLGGAGGGGHSPPLGN